MADLHGNLTVQVALHPDLPGDQGELEAERAADDGEPAGGRADDLLELACDCFSRDRRAVRAPGLGCPCAAFLVDVFSAQLFKRGGARTVRLVHAQDQAAPFELCEALAHGGAHLCPKACGKSICRVFAGEVRVEPGQSGGAELGFKGARLERFQALRRDAHNLALSQAGSRVQADMLGLAINRVDDDPRLAVLFVKSGGQDPPDRRTALAAHKWPGEGPFYPGSLQGAAGAFERDVLTLDLAERPEEVRTDLPAPMTLVTRKPLALEIDEACPVLFLMSLDTLRPSSDGSAPGSLFAARGRGWRQWRP